MRKYRILIFFCLCLLSLNTASAQEYYIDGYVYNYDIEPSANIDRKTVAPYNENFDLFTDHAQGYQVLIPKNSSVDLSFAALRNIFTTPELTVEIAYDDLSTKKASFHEFVNYSNKFLRSSSNLHTMRGEYKENVQGYNAYTTKWQRAKLARIQGDKNFYVSTSIQRTSQQIYTITVKSQALNDTLSQAIISSFTFLEKSGPSRNYKTNVPSKVQMNELTREVYETLFSPESQLTWGIFEFSAPQTFRVLAEKESKLEHKFKVLLRYQTIDEPLPLAQLERAWENGRIVELTLATIHNTQANALWSEGSANARVAYDILDGRYDEYLLNYAKTLKEFNKPIIFRLNNEMNGDWCWYSAFYTGRDAEIYLKLWHYIKSIFDSQGVDNLIWVWNPHDISLPDFSWNNYLAYYPGDEYVDVIGLTGYNNGTYFPGEKWRSFTEIYQGLYANYSLLFDKPFMLTEFSSSSIGGNKAAWITDMFAALKNYPKIKVAVWWNGVDYDQNDIPGRIYLIDDSPEVVEAMRNGLAAYQSKVADPLPEPDAQADEPILRRAQRETLRP